MVAEKDITVVIPTIPPRDSFLSRAMASVAGQTRQPGGVVVEVDINRTGAPTTRNRALEKVCTPWVAFLDDDDWFLPQHLETLANAADSGADVYYSGCTVVNGSGTEVLPRQEEWGRFGLPFDADLLRQKSYIPVTSMVRTELAQEVGGFSYPEGSLYEDWGFYLKLLDAGAIFEHVPEITWVWEHRLGGDYAFDGTHNTSGRADRW